MSEFSGETPFVQHNSRHGWVVFTEESGVNGSPGPTAAVRVAFGEDSRPTPATTGTTTATRT